MRLDQSGELRIQETEGILISLADNQDGGDGVYKETTKNKGFAGSQGTRHGRGYSTGSREAVQAIEKKE